MGDAMLIILMAIINFSRMKVHAATRWLWLALSGGMFVVAPVGCERECNCRCECGQPPATVTAPVDGADAVAGAATGKDVAQAAPDSAGAAADAKSGPAKTGTDVAVNRDAGPATTVTETTPTKKTPRKKTPEPAKESEKVVVPDVPQVAYGPPPVLDPDRIIQPLYGMPVDRDRMPQILYGPPVNRDPKDSD